MKECYRCGIMKWSAGKSNTGICDECAGREPTTGETQKVYRGSRPCRGGGATVTVNDKPLRPRLDLAKHSPDGFEWGYNGSGPTQLALALLADHLDHDTRALALYQKFKEGVIATIDTDDWEISDVEMELYVDIVEGELALDVADESSAYE